MRIISLTTPLLLQTRPSNTIRTSLRRSISTFNITEHIVRCQHSRDRPAGAAFGTGDRLRLAVKQYTPTDNSDPKPGDVTIIGAHANAFPKELYEPLWDDLYHNLKSQGKSIRGIWIADVVNQGQSGVLNADHLGPDPSWWDHGRDLLFLINQFQDDMPQPLVGIGHSMGGMHLAHLSLLHPRLLCSLVLLDPVIQRPNPSKPYAVASTYRRDTWPSLASARESYGSSKFYQRWDPRVLAKWIDFGLQESGSGSRSTNNETQESEVTLSTSPAQEVFTFLRPAYHDDRMLLEQTDGKHMKDDLPPEDADESFPFYRPEPAIMARRLPELKPSVLYVFGATSELSSSSERQNKISSTGTGLGGSGGLKNGRVKEVVLDCGHLVPMEKVTESAVAAGSFLNAELDRWSDIQAERKKRWERIPESDRTNINEAWRTHIGPPPQRRHRKDDAVKK